MVGSFIFIRPPLPFVTRLGRVAGLSLAGEAGRGVSVPPTPVHRIHFGIEDHPVQVPHHDREHGRRATRARPAAQAPRGDATSPAARGGTPKPAGVTPTNSRGTS